jgi:hypothetical protein
MEESTGAVRALLNKWEQSGVRVIDPLEAMCGPKVCDIVRGGAPLYFDSHHLSIAGAELVVGSGGLERTASAARAPARGAAAPAL